MAQVTYSIYVITNLINKKRYVGQTKYSLGHRFQYHGYPSTKGMYISRSIQKYGIKNFTIELIDECFSEKEADLKEIYWIKESNTLAPSGYNLTEGGQKGGGAVSKSSRLQLSRNIKKYYQTHKYHEHRRKPGELNPSSKLTEIEVKMIKWLFSESNVSKNILVTLFNISISTIKNIKYNTAWTHVVITSNDFTHEQIEEVLGVKIEKDTGGKVKGSKNSKAKLNEIQVAEIKKLLIAGNHTQKAIGKMYGVNQDAICCINKGYTWAHVK